MIGESRHLDSETSDLTTSGNPDYGHLDKGGGGGGGGGDGINDDNTIQAVLKHPSIGIRGQVLKTYKGTLDEEIPYPSFLADTSHHVKVVAKHIFSIVNKSRAQ